MELPAVRQSDNIVIHNGFISSYNTETLVPDWVAYELTDEEAQMILNYEAPTLTEADRPAA